jgi:1-acyl-sn-glycerol-3-phosphate acyltransferase
MTPENQPEFAPDELPRCAALTRKGEQCRNRVLPGERYCRVHIAQATEEEQPEPIPAPAAELPEPPASAAAEPAEEPAPAAELPEPPAPAEEPAPAAEPAEEPEPLVLAGESGTSTETAAAEVRALAQRVQTQVDRGASLPQDTGNIAVGLLRLLADNLERMSSEQAQPSLERLQRASVHLQDYFNPVFWLEVWAVVEAQMREQVAFVQRRLQGEYQTDPYGMDPELIERIRPLFTFFYRTWWRIQAQGLEHVPADTRGVLVSNHSGVLPWDGAMIAAAVYEDHPQRQGRVVRNLFLDWFSSQPFLAPLFTSLGQMAGIPENAIRLLEDDELVCVFPEGARGVSKPFYQRYQLARFGRGGFVKIALRTGAPLIPVAVVGAEEIYPMFVNATPLARMFNLPLFPLTPTFPWLGPLGAVPLPTRWTITFCPPISTAEYGPEAADDPLTVFMLTEQVRSTIQQTLDENVAQRTSIF